MWLTAPKEATPVNQTLFRKFELIPFKISRGKGKYRSRINTKLEIKVDNSVRKNEDIPDER